MKVYISLFTFITLLFINLKGQTANPASFINPTGYYSLDNKTKVDSGETYGYFGTIKVKLIDSSRIFVDFYVCKGAPSYNSGTFEDTLTYSTGIAVHSTIDDPTCVITFNFNTPDGVKVEEKAKDFNSGCGFGHAIVATGFYKKITGVDSRPKGNK